MDLSSPTGVRSALKQLIDPRDKTPSDVTRISCILPAQTDNEKAAIQYITSYLRKKSKDASHPIGGYTITNYRHPIQGGAWENSKQDQLPMGQPEPLGLVFDYSSLLTLDVKLHSDSPATDKLVAELYAEFALWYIEFGCAQKVFWIVTHPGSLYGYQEYESGLRELTAEILRKRQRTPVES